MTDLVYDYISMGVDMILTAAILSSIVVLLRSSVVLSSYQANLQANSDRMNYYKQYNMYDCTDNLCSADVLSAMIYYRYELEMVIKNQDGTIMFTNKYGGHSIDGTFYRADGTVATVEDLQNTLKSNWYYRSYLVEDMQGSPTYSTYSGGLVTGIVFEFYRVGT